MQNTLIVLLLEAKDEGLLHVYPPHGRSKKAAGRRTDGCRRPSSIFFLFIQFILLDAIATIFPWDDVLF